jgi:hypothetical protein
MDQGRSIKVQLPLSGGLAILPPVMGPPVLVAVAPIVLGPIADDVDLDSIVAFVALGLLCAVGWWLWRAR